MNTRERETGHETGLEGLLKAILGSRRTSVSIGSAGTLEDVPEVIRKQIEEFQAFWEKNDAVPLSDDLANSRISHTMHIGSGLCFDKETGVASVRCSGVLPEITTKGTEEGIGSLIGLIMRQHQEFKNATKQKGELKAKYHSDKEALSERLDQLKTVFNIKFSAIVETGAGISIARSSELENAPDLGSEFYLLIDGVPKTGKHFDVPAQLGSTAVDLQEKISELEERIEEVRNKFNALAEKTPGLREDMQININLLGDRIKEDELFGEEDGTPFAIALDSEKDDQPLFILAKKFEHESTEISSSVKRSEVISHLTGKNILDEKILSALGISSVIKEIEGVLATL